MESLSNSGPFPQGISRNMSPRDKHRDWQAWAPPLLSLATNTHVQNNIKSPENPRLVCKVPAEWCRSAPQLYSRPSMTPFQNGGFINWTTRIFASFVNDSFLYAEQITHIGHPIAWTPEWKQVNKTLRVNSSPASRSAPAHIKKKPAWPIYCL